MSTEKTWPVKVFRFTESSGWQKAKWKRPKKQGSSRTVDAAPRKDSIVIPGFRQKFSLRLSDGEKSYVIRRGVCLLLVSKRRVRSLLLRFESLLDCLEFSDRFAELNKEGFPSEDTTSSAATSFHSSLSPPAVLGDSSGVAVTAEQREEVASFLAQLLRDHQFMGLVSKLEAYIQNASDGAQLLEGLKYHETDSS